MRERDLRLRVNRLRIRLVISDVEDALARFTADQRRELALGGGWSASDR